MLDMTIWPTLKVDVVDGLQLDPMNVRLDLPEDAIEADIIQELFQNEKALSLVNNIASTGLYTHEMPIVVERDGELVVVDGNRRVAALKAIQNPYLAPAHQSRINKAVAGMPHRDALRNIQVKLAPSQEDADKLIAALHTGNHRVAWPPAQQAAFFQAQLDAGKSLEELADLYPTIDISKFLIRARIIALFRGVDYDDVTVQDFIQRRRFPFSTLERLYEHPPFLTTMGLSIDENSRTVYSTLDPLVFKTLATRVIVGIKEGTLNTRTLNTKDGDTFTNLLKDLNDIRSAALNGSVGPLASFEPNQDSQGKANHKECRESESLGTSETKPPTSEMPSNQKGVGSSDLTSPARPHHRLVSQSLIVNPQYPRSIHAIATELSTINITSHPNATLDLIRTFIEKLIKAYAARESVIIKPKNRRVRFLQLDECLLWLSEYFADQGKTALVQPVRKFRDGNYSFTKSKEHLDAINHNHNIVASKADVRECWDTVESFVLELLK